MISILVLDGYPSIVAWDELMWRGMLELHKTNPRMPQDKERLKREMESTDRQIDRLVYELYGLTEDEVKVVEGK